MCRGDVEPLFDLPNLTPFPDGFKPTFSPKAAGWENRSNIVYSSKIQGCRKFARAEYDEWYIFGSPTDLGTSHLGDNVFEVPQEHGHVSLVHFFSNVFNIA